MSDDVLSSIRMFRHVVEGDDDAATDLFDRYVHRLSALAKSRLAPRLKSRVDPEDIVLSAWRSFFVAARDGRFQVSESGDLWALLTTITLRKLYRTAAHHGAEKRDARRSVDLSDLTCLSPDREPTPEEAAELSDEIEGLLKPLVPIHRRIVELRLQDERVVDIAAETGASERTVRRVLSDLRRSLAERYDIQIPARPVRPVRSREAITPQHADTDISFKDLTLKRMLGRGGMGKVYAAVDRRTNERIAVKFLHRRLQEHPEAVRLFLNEARIIRGLSHPGIVPIRGIGRTEAGVYFLAMDLIEGQDLGQLTSRLSSPEVVRLCLGIAEALEVAHAADVIHCDLKPTNVLLKNDGQPVIVDFGLARAGRNNRSQHAIGGTAPWMAPEQIEAEYGAITERTDVYGLGALMYTLLTGLPPYSGSRAVDVLSQIISSAVPAGIVESNRDADPKLRSGKAGRYDPPRRLARECRSCTAFVRIECGPGSRRRHRAGFAASGCRGAECTPGRGGD